MSAASLPMTPADLRGDLKIAIDASGLARDCYEHLNALALLAGTSSRPLVLTSGDITMLLTPVIEQLRVLTLMIERNQMSAELRLVFDE